MIELVKKEKPKGIWVGDMKDGDVGVIVGLPYKPYLGSIIQRYGNDLIFIGMTNDNAWSKSFNPNVICRFSAACRVRLLEKGERLVVT